MQPCDRIIRWASTVGVIVLAGIAAVISYKHMYQLVLQYGESSWTAALLPVSVDGMIVVASLSLLADSRHGHRSGLLPWTLLVLGSAASLAANVAAAEPSVVGRVIAAWPSCALIGAYELLMRQVRHSTRHEIPATSSVPHTNIAAGKSASYESPSGAFSDPTGRTDVSYAVHTSVTKDETSSHLPSYGTPTGVGRRSATSYRSRASDGVSLVPRPGSDQDQDARGVNHASRRRRRPASGLQRQAWKWAQANRTPAGELPSGKAIAAQFGRRERWGRLVKQAGVAGRLDPVAT